MDTIDMSMDACIARGLAWMVEHGAEFEVDINRVVLDAIDMGSTTWCVLGQAYRPGASCWGDPVFNTALSAVTGDWYGPVASAWAREHGFMTELDDDDTVPHMVRRMRYVEYTNAWRSALAAHRVTVA